MEINAPAIQAELETLLTEYETALITNDVTSLSNFFWNSPLAIRFGVTEELYGAEEIAAFRKSRVINFSNRKAERTSILTFGADAGITTLEFSVEVGGVSRHGRQTQVWARMPDMGWKILSAHVSHRVEAKGVGETYASATSRLIEVPVIPEYLTGAGHDLDTMATLAKPLMDFEFPEETEPAPRFIP